MEKISGEIKMLGNSTMDKNSKKYSVIEVGETILRDKDISYNLDNFLHRAHEQTGNSTIFVFKKMIIGIKLPDGKLYCYKAKILPAIVLTTLPLGSVFIYLSSGTLGTILTIPFLCFSLVAMMGGVLELRRGKYSNQLQAMGGLSV